jgi:hypothetical protein
MLLSCIFLEDVGGVNSFRENSSVYMTEGDTVEVYLQLRDLSVHLAQQGYNPPGRRFIPAAGATLQVEIASLDDTKKVVRFATQPFPSDPSIWKFTIQPADPIRGTKQLRLTLTEGAKITRGVVQQAILAASIDGLAR